MDNGSPRRGCASMKKTLREWIAKVSILVHSTWYSAPVNHLSGLNDRQKEAAEHLEGPLLIVAGAGAGKTKTITHRIAHIIAQGARPDSILAVTFTNKAAAEMRSRALALLGLEPSLSPFSSRSPRMTTFHSLGVQILREHAGTSAIPTSFNIWDRDDSTRLIKRILTERGLERFTPRAVLGRISREKGKAQTVASFAESAHSFETEEIAEVWRRYEEGLRHEGALDFDDLLLHTLLLLRENAVVREKLRERWQHLTIDEYQDTNRVQYEIARTLAGERMNICAVGDIDQNIYSWRGADPRYTLSFERDFPNAKVILLEENYRSTQTILSAANAVIAKNTRRFEKRLFTGNPTGEAITLYAGASDREEAQFVARTTRELLGSGVLASEIAVLFRENFQSRALEEAFIWAGIPYRVLGVRFFDRAEVKDVLAYVRAALNPRALTDFARAAGTPTRGIGKQTLEKIARGEDAALSGAARAKVDAFRGLLGKIRTALLEKTASEALRYTVLESGIERLLAEGDDEARERLTNIFELISHAMRFDELPAPQGIEKLLEDAALMGEQDALQDSRERPVSLMTIHAAKGLEFDAVFVTGLEQGLFPSERANDTERDDEEERRLFYVALTRAKKYLYLTLAGARMKYGSREHTIPSSFLHDIDERLITYADTRAFEPTIEL